MKLAEFNALCDREWTKQDRGGRGDVISLRLTEPGWEELSREVAASMERGFFSLGSLSGIVNPVTRSPVRVAVRKGGKRETARVRVMGGTCRQTWWPAST
jgi:hypothetical protein